MPRPKKPKPLKQNHFWSIAERRILRKHYETGGRRAVQGALFKAGYHRTIYAINKRARREGLTYRAIPDDYILLSHVHPSDRDGDHHSSKFIRRRATEDKVLRYFGEGRDRLIAVPIWWADAYIEEAGDRMAVDRARGGLWYPMRDAAKLFGCSFSYLGNARNMPERYSLMASFIEMCEVEEGLAYTYWEPVSTENAARAYRAWRRKSSRARCVNNEPSRPAAHPAQKAA